MISLPLTLVLGFALDLCNNKDITLILAYNYNIQDGDQANIPCLEINEYKLY